MLVLVIAEWLPTVILLMWSYFFRVELEYSRTVFVTLWIVLWGWWFPIILKWLRLDKLVLGMETLTGKDMLEAQNDYVSMVMFLAQIDSPNNPTSYRTRIQKFFSNKFPRFS